MIKMNLCKCGCGLKAKPGNVYIFGHQSRRSLNPFFGKHHSKIAKEKMRIAKLGKKCPDISERMTGEKNPMFGKVLPHLVGDRNPMKNPEARKKKSDEVKKFYSSEEGKMEIERMKNGGASYANSFNKSPSKPQCQLFERVKILYPSAILNYPVMNYSIDIAIPKLKIAIEFDGYYFHKDREKADQRRQRRIEREGWGFLRYSKLPDDNKLNQDLLNIQNSFPIPERRSL